LSRGGVHQDVWLPRRAGVEVIVPLGAESIGLAYAQRREPLGFAVALQSAKFTTESASGLPEIQASQLEIRDADSSITRGETTLNEPFQHRGYKLYQGVIQKVGEDEQGKPLHRSVLLVGYDPGVWFKYAGSLFVCIGITCMFWMKAYFFGSWWEDGAASSTESEAAAPSETA